ncbi:MAG: hypothetical protein Q9219_006747 [cf. Caloplaca sp. 3 TL-2023]
MVVQIVQLSLCIAIGYTAWSFIALESNVRRAKFMGIPIVRLPVDPQNIPWVIIEPTLWRLLDLLPLDWGSFGRYSRRGWHFYDKADSHLHYGPVWALVTPRDVYVYLADPCAIVDVFQRREDFLRPSKMYKLLEVYGPCISTASWRDWPRHRKILAAPFNESRMQFVWTESLKQAKEMVKVWARSTESGIQSVAKDTRTLSLNVLAATGFQRSYSFRSSDHLNVSEADNYRNALQTVLDNAIFLMLVPPRIIRLPFLPRSWTRVGKAAAAFKQYMVDMLDTETSLRDRGEKGTGSLMTSFVRALDTSQQEITAPKGIAQVSKGLTVDEIYGNIFVINFAGHDTTANTLAFSMLLLAANRDIQDWVADELRSFITSDRVEDWDYSTLFPYLKRSRAILLETLRLYPPIPALPKWTNEKPQAVHIGDKVITIPPHTGVMPSLLAMQSHPEYWSDPLHWKPSRWIEGTNTESSGTSSLSSLDLNTRLQQESLVTPIQGIYFPWSDGPQNCPGERFAQVEFVAVLASILRDHRIGIITRLEESWAQARARTLATTEDCDLGLLLRMRNADTVRLSCKMVGRECN